MGKLKAPKLTSRCKPAVEAVVNKLRLLVFLANHVSATTRVLTHTIITSTKHNAKLKPAERLSYVRRKPSSNFHAALDMCREGSMHQS
jgi:hypothetical protein